MKTSKPKVQKKDAKKAERKQLEKSVIGRFSEVVTSMGHDAAQFTKELEIAGKFIAKKLSKKAKQDKEAKVAPQPVVQSVKVEPIATAEKAAEALKPKPKAPARKPATRAPRTKK